MTTARDLAEDFVRQGLTRISEGPVVESDAVRLASAYLDLERRAEDLELVLRAKLRATGKGRPHVIKRVSTDRWLVQAVGFIPDDGTGLPALTDEARAALRKEAR